MKSKIWKKRVVPVLLFVGFMLGFGGCQKEQNEPQKEQVSENQEDIKEETVVIEDLSDAVKKDTYRNKTAIHDASLFKDGNLYYAFGSHMAAATSGDLWNWELVANGVTDENRLFSGLFESEAFAWCGKNKGVYSVWAPDVIYNSKMGKYCMYFAVLGEDEKASICLAVSDSVTGPFSFSGRVIDSGFDRENANKTLAGKMFGKKLSARSYFDENGNYNTVACPAALDPCVFYDAEGGLWLAYGSGNGGIYLLELDEKTGLAVPVEDGDGVDSYFGRHILGAEDASCEAPYIMYHEDNGRGYYYLFVSYGNTASDGGYDIREFRSQQVEGPYVDAMGQSWTEPVEDHASCGVRLIGNYQLPGNADAYVSSGHPAVVTDSDGRFLLVHHTRFADNSGEYELRVRQMFLNEAGWLMASPFQINNLKEKEELKETGYSTSKLLGTYYVINHGNEITADIRKAQAISLEKENEVFGIGGGYWEKIDDMPYANITLEDQTYQGIFIKQKDEGGHDVIVFTGICEENNQAIWAVKYLELGKSGDTLPEAEKAEPATDAAVEE